MSLVIECSSCNELHVCHLDIYLTVNKILLLIKMYKSQHSHCIDCGKETLQ